MTCRVFLQVFLDKYLLFNYYCYKFVVGSENFRRLISGKKLLNHYCQANSFIVNNLQNNFNSETLIIN